MFKKHMTPIGRNGTLHNAPGKGSSQRDLPSAATGGGPASFQSYAKATPMAEPQQPAPPSPTLGTGSYPGDATA